MLHLCDLVSARGGSPSWTRGSHRRLKASRSPSDPSIHLEGPGLPSSNFLELLHWDKYSPYHNLLSTSAAYLPPKRPSVGLQRDLVSGLVMEPAPAY